MSQMSWSTNSGLAMSDDETVQWAFEVAQKLVLDVIGRSTTNGGTIDLERFRQLTAENEAWLRAQAGKADDE